MNTNSIRMESLIVKAKLMLPLIIENVELNGDQLLIAGENWAICLSTAWWRVVNNGTLLFGCTDEIADRIMEIQGAKIEDIEVQSKTLPCDWIIYLSNGLQIEFFSTSSLEPWSISIGAQTYYFNPSLLGGI